MSKKEGIHTTIEGDIYNNILLPFSNQKNVSLNVVLETLLQIAYELCEQNNMEINSNSLFEIKKRVSRKGCQFVNSIVVQTDDKGETTIFIPKEHKEVFYGLIKSIQDKTTMSGSGELITEVKEKNDLEKNIKTSYESPLLRERVEEYLKKFGGSALRSDIKEHFKFSRQSMCNVLKELKLGGKIENNKNNNIIKLV